MDTLITTGEPAPDFELSDLDENIHRLSDLRGRILVVNFWSAECPWAERADRALLDYQDEWGDSVELWSIASNANESQDMLVEVSRERSVSPVLPDPEQRLADLFGAQTTPHIFVVDGDGVLRYQGAFDDTTFRQRAPTRSYLQEAVEALLAGRRLVLSETNPYGCTIVRHTA